MATRIRRRRVALLRPPQLRFSPYDAQPVVVQTADITVTATEDRAALPAEDGCSAIPSVVTGRRLCVDVPAAVVEHAREHNQQDSAWRAIGSLVAEAAYDLYGRGTGDVLGPSSVSFDDRSMVYTIQFICNGSATTINASDLTGYYWSSSSTDGSNVVLADWQGIDWGHGPLAAATPVLSRERIEIINRKAKELLLSQLNETQRKTWLAEQYFDMKAPSGRRYRLTAKRTHNVFLLDSLGKPVREYCAYADDPGGTLPLEDHLFAQLVTLQFNELEFLATANTWDLREKRTFVGQGRDAQLLAAA